MSKAKQNNPAITEIAAAICKFWTFKLGFKGGGFLVRSIHTLFPQYKRFYLDYPGFGRCNIRFLDFLWLRQVSCGLNEERSLMKALESLPVQYPVIWDIGANSGYLAVEIMLRMKPSSLVLFEPNPEHKETLQSIAAIDRKIQVYMVGLSDHKGNAILHVPGYDSGSSCASLVEELVKSNKQLHSLNVKLVTGDSFLTSGDAPVPNLIILDVEGHEKSVIAGLHKTIHKNKPIIVMEHIFLSAHDLSELLPDGYTASTICDDSGDLISGMDKKRGHNLLLRPM